MFNPVGRGGLERPEEEMGKTGKGMGRYIKGRSLILCFGSCLTLKVLKNRTCLVICMIKFFLSDDTNIIVIFLLYGHCFVTLLCICKI